MKIKICALFFAAALVVAGCAGNGNTTNEEKTNKAVAGASPVVNKAGDATGSKNFGNKPDSNARQAVNPRAAATTDAAAKNACLSVRVENKRVVAEQTFPIDFEPYQAACFVTFADPAQMVNPKDLPRGSEFYIFKDGKQISRLPDAFDNQTGCWIEGAAFEDLNSDSLTAS